MTTFYSHLSMILAYS